MTPEMKQRLLAFADEEIARQSEQFNYLGGNRVVVEDRLVSLPTLAVPVQEEREETWVLALIASSERLSDILPPNITDPAVAGVLPRSSGLYASISRFPVTVVESVNPTPPGTPFYIRFQFTLSFRTYEPSVESLPSPSGSAVPDDWGQPYPATVAFDLEERKQSDFSLVSTREVVVPPEGTTILVAASVPDLVVTYQPGLASFRRVR